MVDIEKLSEIGKAKEEKGGINIMDAIKGVTSLIKEAKGLQEMAHPKPQIPIIQSQPQQQPTAQPTQQQPQPQQPIQSQPIKPKEQPQKVTVEEKQQKGDKYFNKVIQLINMGVLVYGDLLLSQFKDKLIEDKKKIIEMIGENI